MGIVTDAPLGRAEVAQLLGVKPSTVNQWMFRGIFPDPDIQTARQALWLHSTIRTWALMTDRWPYDKDEWGPWPYEEVIREEEAVL